MSRHIAPVPREVVSDPGATGPQRELSAFLEAPLRKPFHVIVPLVLVTGLAVAASLVVPKRYVAWSVVALESRKAPNALARGGGEDPAKPRLGALRQELLTRVRLERVIRETDPYPQMMTEEPLHIVVDEMRHQVEIIQKGPDAFGISYVNRHPRKAQLALSRLINLFVEEANETRTEQVEGTAEFLEAQLQGARQQLEGKDQEIRLYKEANLGHLPDQMPGNLATLQRLQLEQQSLVDSLRLAREKQALLEHGSTPPDASGVTAPVGELEQARQQLATLRGRYTDEHPDVRALLARVARLEAAPTTGRSSPGRPVLDPVRAQLEATRLEIRSLEARHTEMDRRIAVLQGLVDETPRAQQELGTLTRDYEKLNENYLNLFKRKLDAEMARRLEERWQGERYRVLEDPYLPEKPSFPKPWLFALVGAIVGLGAGLGTAVLGELLDHSVKGLRELEASLPFPVLATFPHVRAREVIAKTGRRSARG